MCPSHWGPLMQIMNILKMIFIHPGLKHCKMNVHLLSHLPHYIKLFGPLWTHSAFAFEDSIGYLVKRAHATHDIANQVIYIIILYM